MTYDRLYQSALASIPQEPPDIVDYSEEHVRLVSVKSERFSAALAPWLPTIMRTSIHPEVRRTTFVKPVQIGGSVAGECFIAYICKFGNGHLQMNWEKNDKMEKKWAERIEPMLRKSNLNFADLPHNYVSIGQVKFPRVFFTAQGVWVPENLDSDTITNQVNEEIHSWEEGHLDKAFNRTRQVWNSHTLNISNAGVKEGQLHQAFTSGTMQYWQVKCPGCKQMHTMRTRWEDRHANLGGLRYNADGARLGKFKYDYNKIKSTIFYQFPCGYRLYNDQAKRRLLSASGAYSEPTNAGALLRNRSFTLDSVAVDSIDWVEMIETKHRALHARAYGNIGPWKKYVMEVECNFYSAEDAPVIGITVLSEGVKKAREGFPDRAARIFSGDYQKGDIDEGETRHWWLTIRDFRHNGSSILVYEGKLDTDGELEAVLNEHGIKTPDHEYNPEGETCRPDFGALDSGWDTTHVYNLAYRLGINAIKMGNQGKELFKWPDSAGGGEHIYSQDQPLYRMMDGNHRPKYYSQIDGDEFAPHEPQFWHVNYNGMRDLLWWYRGKEAAKLGIEYITPDDVSDKYKEHQEAEELKITRNQQGVESHTYEQLKKRNDQLHNEAVIVMIARRLGIPVQYDENQTKEHEEAASAKA